MIRHKWVRLTNNFTLSNGLLLKIPSMQYMRVRLSVRNTTNKQTNIQNPLIKPKNNKQMNNPTNKHQHNANNYNLSMRIEI